MAWTPQRAYFAVIALPADRAERAARLAGPVPPLVVLTGDDFADVLARRATLLRLGPGCPLQVVWGVDGAPVTAREYERLFFERAASAVMLLPPDQPGGTRVAVPHGLCQVGPVHRLPPEHPRALRPEASPTPPAPRMRWAELDDAPVPTTCPACRLRTRTLLVAGEPPSCDSLRHHAPNKTPTADSSHF